MSFSHDITFCNGADIDCLRKDECYRHREIERIPNKELYSVATLYKYVCREANNYQLYIKDREKVNED